MKNQTIDFKPYLFIIFISIQMYKKHACVFFKYYIKHYIRVNYNENRMWLFHILYSYNLKKKDLLKMV